MEDVNAKKIESVIKSHLQQGSYFCLRDNIRFKPKENSLDNKEESVQLLIANGMLPLEDIFLVATIHSLGDATPPIILRKLALEKRRNPEQAIPFFDLRTLKWRLKLLVKHGLLYSFSYDIGDEDTSVVIYRCTMLGWRVFKTRLMQNIAFDKLAHYRSTSDTLRKLATNAVAYSFAGNDLCKSVILNETVTYGESNRPAKINLYARTSLENEHTKRRYIIEPTFFLVEKEITTEEQNESRIDERLSQLQTYIEERIEKDAWDVRLVLVVENLDGLQKLLALIKRKDMNFFMQYAIFTAENIIANNNYRLSTSFLKMAIVRGKNTIKLDCESILS